MAKTKISEFDVNPDNNTDINNINIAEGCAPSGINNAIRQLMSDLKEFQTGAGGDSFTVGGAFSANGGATLGDASGDALTINSSAVSIPNGLAFSGGNISTANNLIFTGTGNRITGDFSNATVASRVFFQTSTVNGSTNIGLLPNGTGNTTNFIAYNGTDPANSARLRLNISDTIAALYSDITGTGTYLPLTMYTGGSERLRIDTSGNVGIGTSSPVAKLQAQGSVNSGVSYSIYTDNSSTTGTTLAGIGFSNAGSLKSSITAAVYNNDFMAFNVGGSGTTERMRIDSSGNVGIGTSSTGNYGKFQVSNGTNQFVVGFNANRPIITATNNAGNAYVDLLFDGTTQQFYTNGGERVRIDSSGNLLVGTTTLVTDANCFNYSPGNTWGIFGHVTGVASGTEYIKFRLGSSQIGSITQNGTTAVAYNTSSDYRLKENIAPMTGALATVAQLKPVTYTWKVDGSTGQGFIAHELQAVVPDCVTGEKDAVETYIDEDGVEQTRPKYQGIDTSFLVATLTAAIQEQQAIITDLKARIETLESK